MVLEKVHGANFSFHITQHGDVKVARRRAVLKENENFFSHLDAQFMKTYPKLMKDLHADILTRFPDLKICQVSVWGELFGGVYVVNGEDLNTKNMKQVQTEIQYCPHIDWIGYDISYRVEGSEDTHEYLDYDVAMDLFERHNISYSKPLFKGPMNQALNWDLDFQSTLPNILGMPALPANTNHAMVSRCQDCQDEVRIFGDLQFLSGLSGYKRKNV